MTKTLAAAKRDLTRARAQRRKAADAEAARIDKALGEQLRERRNDVGMSQAELGEAIGGTQAQIQKYEAGLNRISVSTGIAIAAALGVTLGAFVSVVEREADRRRKS